MIRQLEEECLNVYWKKVDTARKHKADLHQALEDGKAEISHLMLALGDHESLCQVRARSSVNNIINRLHSLISCYY